MEVPYLVGGVFVLGIASIDLLWTTLWIEGGAGPLNTRLLDLEWWVLKRVDVDNRILSLSGPILLVSSLVVWIALLWSGWAMLFAADETALLNTRAPGAISWSERFYYVGYTIFTMGNGEFSPQGGIWQVSTAFMAGSGMLFVTLSVTYILSIMDAVTQKRAFASSVSGLGADSETIVQTSWNGDEFEGLALPLNTFTTELNTLTANHRAYPLLHYFYSTDPQQAPAVSVVLLDEMLTVLRFGIVADRRPHEIILRNARASVHHYLETLDTTFIDGSERTPPPPNLSPLRDAGLPVVPDSEFTDSLAEIRDRRRELLGLLESDLRPWPNGAPPGDDDEVRVE